jgi:hypothetical protein
VPPTSFPVDPEQLRSQLHGQVSRGLVGKLEPRHDQASRDAFSLEDFGPRPTSRSRDIVSVALQYSPFSSAR